MNDDSDDDYLEAGDAFDLAMGVCHAQTLGQLQTFAYGNGPSTSTHLVLNQGASVSSSSQPLPHCPHASCPGLFTHCGGKLHWKPLEDVSSGMHTGFYGCERFFSPTRCSFKYWPHQVQKFPQISMEIVEASGNSFRVVPAPGAEGAVMRAGGVKAILSAAKIAFDPSAQSVDLMSVSFSLSDYERVEKLARLHKKNLLADNDSSLIPPQTLKSYRQNSLAASQSTLVEEEVRTRLQRMPQSLWHALLPFQREGVAFGIRRKARALIAVRSRASPPFPLDPD